MKRLHFTPINSALLSVFALYLIVAHAFQSLAFADRQDVARLDAIEGVVEGKFVGESDFRKVEIGTVFKESDTIHTGRRSRASLFFVDGVLLRLAPNTTLQFQAVRAAAAPGTPLSIEAGTIHALSREGRDIPVISSPAVSTAIRGTEFVMSVTSDRTVVTVLSGSVECFNDFGRETLGVNEQAITDKGKAPVKSIIVNPKDAVQWALHYPNVVDKKELDSLGALSQSTKEVSTLLDNGDTEGALTLLDQMKKPGAVDLLLKAGALLARGDVDQAEQSIEALVHLLNDNSGLKSIEPYLAAQQAIIHIVKDEKDRAEQLLSPYRQTEAVSIKLADSYLQVARFNLDKAAQLLDQIIANGKARAYVYARRAELAVGAGDFDRAEELLLQAAQIDADDSYLRSVDAFLDLIKGDSAIAQGKFSKLVEQFGSWSLPYLGLGLSRIEQGELSAGRSDLMRAVFLDPGVSIYRSYLGKAFFEEEKEEVADTEFDQAERLDSKDPTPHLYRAFSKVAQNQPVAALQDIETSIDKNNNRAVYRSSLQLDQDLGVRSAGLSEVFTVLGFYQAARVEAIKSINRSYSNYSAHQLLGESYRTIESDDARRSEQKIARVLAPLSFNFFQPPSGAASVNEYSALFNLDEQRTDIGLDAETYNDHIVPSIVQSGKDGRFGYSLAVDGESLWGSRHNNYLRYYHTQGVLQYQPTIRDRFILEGDGYYRRRELDRDLYDDQKLEEYSFEATYLRHLGPATSLFIQSGFRNQRNNFVDSLTESEAILTEILDGSASSDTFALFLDQFSRERVKSSRTTAQIIHDSELVSLVFGSQLYFASPDREETSAIIADELGLLDDLGLNFRSAGYNNTNSVDTYLYTTWHLSDWVDLTLGANQAEVELEEREFAPFATQTFTRSQFNPKVGVTLYPSSDLTVRAAYFEVLRKASLENNLTLEPSLVSGINQRFTDISGTTSRNAGVGLDYKLSGKTYLGSEYIHRDLMELVRIGLPEVTIDYDEYSIDNSTVIGDIVEDFADQDAVRNYLYQVFSPEIVGSLEHFYSSSERTDPGSYQKIQLNRISATMRYFDRSGWYLFGGPTWREQDRIGSFLNPDGNNDFWTLDAGVGYRLPHRHGSITLSLLNILDQEINYDQSFGIEESVFSGIGGALSARFNF